MTNTAGWADKTRDMRHHAIDLAIDLPIDLPIDFADDRARHLTVRRAAPITRRSLRIAARFEPAGA
jgi:hypothetical protein